MRKTRAFWALGILVLTGVVLGTVGVRRLSIGENASELPDGDGLGGVQLAHGERAGVEDRRVLRPVVVDEARIDGGSIVPVGVEGPSADIDHSDLLVTADVGSSYLASMESQAPSRAGGVEENQSDAEGVNLMPEPVHAVAPVPMQEAGLAAMKVKLARVSGANTNAITEELANVIESPGSLDIGSKTLGDLVSTNSALSLHDQIEVRVALGWAMLGQAKYRESVSQLVMGLRIATRIALKMDW